MKYSLQDWLPITRKEVLLRGWDELDVVLISGDAYVDHPSFGTAVIGRIIENMGLRIAIVPQPNWQDDLRDFKKMGKPKLFFGVTSGCMDSMVNHYTANKRIRSTDSYTPGGKSGFRPDYASIVYSKILKQLYPDVPVILGGIEASLRRVTHYDYWSDQLKPSILKESQADMLLYGMAEPALRALVELLRDGHSIEEITQLPQSAFLIPKSEGVPSTEVWDTVEISSHQQCLKYPKKFAANFKIVEQESNKSYARRIIQGVGEHYLIINPPFPVMTSAQIDRSFDLPYTRLPHPKYKNRGQIPAFEMIKFSINMHRGCFGGCSFCTISAHQGKFIASRSEESILKEVEQVTQMPDFKGYISDLGGPSANMYKLQGKDLEICDRCVAPSCIHPVICSNLDTNHDAMVDIYQKVDRHPKVKKAFVGSGIRYDLLTKSYNKNCDSSIDRYMDQLVSRHISGRLKVAPEHTSDATLKVMRKPSFKHFHTFKKMYEKVNRKFGLNQPLIPYFISSHPASDEADMANLAAETKDMGFRLEQVQDFTPTPMTVATVIYYSGFHPYTMKRYYTARSREQRKNQHLFFFWYKKENRPKIRKRLMALGKIDLIEKLLGGAKTKSKTSKKDKNPKASTPHHSKSRRLRKKRVFDNPKSKKYRK